MLNKHIKHFDYLGLLLFISLLVVLQVAVVEPLNKLISLVLHNNPWRCDCHLKAFRDWMIKRNLYAQPTSCVEPPHLANRLWTDVNSDDFACKPQIIYPPPDKATQVEAFGEEVNFASTAIMKC